MSPSSSSSTCSSIEDFYQHNSNSTTTTTTNTNDAAAAAANDGLMYEYQQFPSIEEFNSIVNGYLQNLSSKKRDKALVDSHRYSLILQVLKDPRNTAISTAQFRFWVKKMFRLTTTDHMEFVCHDNKPVATREDIYDILIIAHKEAHHGGRDKTSALVRKRYSWIPKELIARFVRHCPFCISRRNGCQQSSSSASASASSASAAVAMMSKASLPMYTPPSPLCNSTLNDFFYRHQPHHKATTKRKRYSPYSNHHYSPASISMAATVATSAAAAAVASTFISSNSATPTPQDDADFDFFYGHHQPQPQPQPQPQQDSPCATKNLFVNSNDSYSYLLQQQQQQQQGNTHSVTTAASVATAAAMAAVNSSQQHHHHHHHPQMPSSPTSISSDSSVQQQHQEQDFNTTFQSAIAAAAAAMAANSQDDNKFFVDSPPSSSCSLSDDASSLDAITNNIPSPDSFSEHCKLLKQLIE